jgi:putative tricarboxylic transport membrane protein
MGVFGYGEIIQNLSIRGRAPRGVHRQGDAPDTRPAEDFKRMVPAVLRGTAIGSLGILPGGGALLAAFAAYTVEKKTKLQAGRSAVRPGQHPRCGGARVGQQRGLADLLHSRC